MRAHVAQVGELVGDVDRDRVAARLLDLLAVLALALLVVLDALVLGERLDELGDAVAEALRDLVRPISVSSTTSCSSAAAITSSSKPASCSSSATATGCVMYGVPSSLRRWPSCAAAASR